MSQIGGWKIHT